MAAFAYASVSVSSRLGLQYSTPLTATCVAMAVRMTLLWCAVLATGGVPAVARLALPVFFAAVLATVAAVCLAVSMSAGGTRERIAWDRRALLPFVVAGAFETVASLFSLIAVSMGQVVAVAPLVATSPLWTQVLTLLFLRGVERLNVRSVTGTVAVVAGTATIIAAR